MGEMITITAEDGHTLSAYRAGPEGREMGANTRGIVLIQEIFGVNHHIRNMADRFASHGYAVIAPCLFDRVRPGIELGYTGQDVAQGRALRGQVPDDKAMLDVVAASEALTGMAQGIVGYCWGGTIAWWGATRTNRFQVASCWYGGGIAATRAEVPACPVQMHFGDQDTSIPQSDIDAIRQAQPKVQVFVYPGAQHGFGCDERASFNAADAALAQQRTLSFLGEFLQG